MGLKLPRRAPRPVAVTLVVSTLLLLGACSSQDRDLALRLGMPEPATREGVYTLELWQWAWLAAILTGILVWGLIFWVVWRYRRRSDEDVPVQTRYNLPLEIFYTIAPIMMVIVFFYWTVTVQNEVLREDPDPDHTLNVVGQQWSWTFNHTGEDAVESPNVYTVGTASDRPTLVLPVDETVRINLSSPDVIHGFWVPAFLFKMDVIPGRNNNFTFTPTSEGTYAGKCTELCGVSHSRMLFDVEVVSSDEYDAYLQGLEEDGFTSEQPLLGGSEVVVQDGLEDTEETEGGSQ